MNKALFERKKNTRKNEPVTNRHGLKIFNQQYTNSLKTISSARARMLFMRLTHSI